MPNFNISNGSYSYIRFLNAVPNSPAIDIYFNSVLVARRLQYSQFTEYMKIPEAQYQVNIYPTGTQTNPILSTEINIPNGTIGTIAVIGLLPDVSLFPISDPLSAITPGQVCVRFGHLSPNAPAVDITAPDGSMFFDNISYEEITDYLCMDPGRYTLQARLAGTDQVVLTVPNIRLYPNRFYSIYAVGLTDQMPGLQVLIPLDGNSYLQF